MKSTRIVAGIAALLCAVSAQAAQISLTSTVLLGNTLTNGQSQNVQVNVNSLLAGTGFASNSIVSGLLTVTGFSDPDYAPVFATGGGGYVQEATTTHQYKSCNPNGKNCTTKTVTDKNHVKYATNNHLDLVADTMVVKAGDASESDSVSDFNESTTDYGSRVWEKTTGSDNGGYNFFYHRNRDHYLSVSGALEVLLDLDAKALGDLGADGILNLSISSYLGQFKVYDVRLDFVAEKANPADDVQVPVPTSLLLTGLGLAALATVRRRKA
ncbi:PEP-CTERM sorting domain-containing protein [Pseudoduganella violaceinigra]|uniref:PEP-CTERM sorting domain-containing protein n=1 Tax=Pseudoduganella violaceinigra TaxID=246602 RepID=UPI0003FF518D|nr:PEP-CTERM sorting domain-containing protein [Pseudoduganella violaceinigra]